MSNNLTKIKGLLSVVSNIDDALGKVDELLPLPETAVPEARYLIVRLQPLSEDEAFNAKTRRRMKRIITRLTESFPGIDLSVQDVEQIQPTTAVQPTPVEQIDPVAATIQLKEAKNISVVEGVLNSLIGPSSESKEVEEWKALKNVLFDLLSRRDLTNKNLRRRMSRLIYVLSNEQDLVKLNEIKQESQVVQQNVAIAKVAQPMRNPPRPPSQVSSKSSESQLNHTQEHKAEVEQIVIKSLDDCLTEVLAAQSTAELDNATTAVSAGSTVSQDEVRLQLLVELKKRVEDESIVNNAKIKRKVQRLVKTLEGMGVTPASISATTLDLKGGSATIDSIVHQLEAVHSAEQLDTVLAAVDVRTLFPVPPGAGGEDEAVDGDGDVLLQQRRLLKRTIDHVLTQEDVNSSMNAKVRRKVSRLTGALAEGDEGDKGKSVGGVSSSAAAPVVVVAPESTTSLAKKVPYVLFVGNLSYDVTAADIETHLRHVAALEGPLKVRLRSNAATGQSLGVAFVEVEGAHELHQCIAAAHHSTMAGRVINVEKSCGGRNKATRGEKIASRRSEQQVRAEEAVNRVLVQFERSGVLHNVHKWGPTLKDSMYAHSPAHLTMVLFNLS